MEPFGNKRLVVREMPDQQQPEGINAHTRNLVGSAAHRGNVRIDNLDVLRGPTEPVNPLGWNIPDSDCDDVSKRMGNSNPDWTITPCS